MGLNYRLISPPTTEPVSLALVKVHLRVDWDDPANDALIASYISAAREYCESYTHRAFFSQQWQLYLDHFPFWDEVGTLPTRSHNDWPLFSAYYDRIAIRLPRPSCISVDSITYLDLSGTRQTLDPSAYYVDNTSEPARIVPFAGSYWPYTQEFLPGSVTVSYTAGSYTSGTFGTGGFGEGAEGVSTMPPSIIQAILLMTGHLYENRETTSDKPITNVPLAVSALLDPHKFTFFSYSGV